MKLPFRKLLALAVLMLATTQVLFAAGVYANPPTKSCNNVTFSGGKVGTGPTTWTVRIDLMTGYSRSLASRTYQFPGSQNDKYVSRTVSCVGLWSGWIKVYTKTTVTNGSGYHETAISGSRDYYC
jgi:hypothetical protein